jgi:hypothetical protein
MRLNVFLHHSNLERFSTKHPLQAKVAPFICTESEGVEKKEWCGGVWRCVKKATDPQSPHTSNNSIPFASLPSAKYKHPRSISAVSFGFLWGEI